MAEIKSDIKALAKSQQNTQNLLVEHIKTNDTTTSGMLDILRRHDTLLLGDESIGYEGLKKKTDAHEKYIADQKILFSNIQANWKLIMAILGFLGVSSAANLIDLLNNVIHWVKAASGS